LFWWDHVITLLGTGLRIGELAGLHRRRSTSTSPSRPCRSSTSATKPAASSAAASNPDPKVMPASARSPLALAKLTNPATAGLRPTAARVLGALGEHGPLTAEQLAAQLSSQGRTARVATVDQALAELAAAGAATTDAQTQRWTLLPGAQHPLLEAVNLHGAHDFRHTFSTWLEDAGIPARVIDELMGHEASSRRQQRGSAIGAHYRHTTPEMAARVVAAVEERLVVVLTTAEAALDQQPW
jgi:hypothetical protein